MEQQIQKLEKGGDQEKQKEIFNIVHHIIMTYRNEWNDEHPESDDE